jgi:homocysteine S-methyltransferase
VYDVDAIGLVELLTHLNHGVDFHGRAIDAPTSFFTGVPPPDADDLELEAERFRRKVEAGAQFAMTQIVFDLSYLESFLERIGGSPIRCSWACVRSARSAGGARAQRDAGIVVPDHVRAVPRRRRVCGRCGPELARELIAGRATWRRASTSSRRSGVRGARPAGVALATARRDGVLRLRQVAADGRRRDAVAGL